MITKKFMKVLAARGAISVAQPIILHRIAPRLVVKSIYAIKSEYVIWVITIPSYTQDNV